MNLYTRVFKKSFLKKWGLCCGYSDLGLLCLSLYQWAIFKICEETGHSVELVDAPKKPKRNFRVKEFVLLDPANEALHMHPETCYGLGLPNFTCRHLGPAREECWPVDLAGYNVINKKTSVYHDSHTRF